MTTKSHKNHAESAGRGPTRELSENEKGRVQLTPEERTTDRDLGAPSPATVPTIPYRSRDTGGEILGKEHKEKTGEQRIPQRRTRCGELSCPSDSEVLEERKRKRP